MKVWKTLLGWVDVCQLETGSLPLLSAFFYIYWLISREHATGAQSMAKNQMRSYQNLNYNERMNISECEHSDGWNGWVPELYSFKFFFSSQTIFFANSQLHRSVWLMQWVCIIISGFLLFEEHIVIKAFKKSFKYSSENRTVLKIIGMSTLKHPSDK